MVPTPTIDLLPTDVLLRVTDSLSVGDLHSLRLAGLGSRDAALHAALAARQRRRVVALQTIMQHVSGPANGRRHMSFHRAGSATFFPCWNAACARYRPVALDDPSVPQKRHGVPCSDCHLRPDAIALYDAAVGRLHASMPARDTDDIGLTLVSREFPRVRSLQVSASGPDNSEDLPTPINQLRGIDMFERLHTLELHGCAIATLPDAVLRLCGLRNLILMRMPGLRVLPADMGDRLAQLAYLQLYFTGVGVVPRSVWDALERNFGRSLHRPCISVVLREGTVRQGPIFDLLDMHAHPQLHQQLKEA